MAVLSSPDSTPLTPRCAATPVPRTVLRFGLNPSPTIAVIVKVGTRLSVIGYPCKR